MNNIKQLKLVLDKAVVDKYNTYYFTQHPKAKKKAIEFPYHPSINVWSIKPRIQMNHLKQTWKAFIIHWINELGYTNLKLDKYEIEYHIYHLTKRRTDPDNFSPKFIMDGFTESGFIVDDDREHCKKLTIICDVDKNNPRTEIIVTILDSKREQKGANNG